MRNSEWRRHGALCAISAFMLWLICSALQAAGVIPLATPSKTVSLKVTRTASPRSPVVRSSAPKARPSTTRVARRAIPTPTPTYKHSKRTPTPTATFPIAKPKVPVKTRPRVRTKPVRFLFNVGGGLTFPDSDRFDGRGGPMIRGGVEVYVWRYWTLGLRGQAEDFEWTIPDPSDPSLPADHRHTRLYGGAVLSRLFLGRSGSRPYLMGGVGVFKSEAGPDLPTGIYPHKGPFYPVAFGMDFELNPKWTLGVEACVLYLEDRASRHVTQMTNLGVNMGFGID